MSTGSVWFIDFENVGQSLVQLPALYQSRHNPPVTTPPSTSGSPKRVALAQLHNLQAWAATPGRSGDADQAPLSQDYPISYENQAIW